MKPMRKGSVVVSKTGGIGIVTEICKCWFCKNIWPNDPAVYFKRSETERYKVFLNKSELTVL